MSNDARDTMKTVKNDTKDTLDEAKHRAQATGERLSRDVQGDAMPLGDRVKSNVKEALHNTKADFDAAKRDARHGETDDRA
jgi:hypothetical protein